MQATFPGGNGELVAFLLKNMEYPKKARKEGVEGTVYVKFIIATNGEITDASYQK